MTHPESNIRVNVDVTNPGQFFACCGLLELADRLWPGAEGWFEFERFSISSDGTLNELLMYIVDACVKQVDPENDTSSPIRISHPFDITVDWWADETVGGRAMKVWAGRMSSVRIARAMRRVIADAPDPSRLLDYATVVYDPDDPRKKVEPFYFDSRRGWNAQSVDIGFSPDSFRMTTAAFPAVEFLCLVGLQRFRPTPSAQRRVFTYFTWPCSLPLEIAPAAVCGAAELSGGRAYRFETAFRTDQKKHKAFLPATPIGDST